MVNRPLIIGHRGYPARYPENTLLSFMSALYYGADGVELDVWLSGDGVPVVIHDEDTLRVSGEPRRVKESSIRELRRAYLGMGQTIPTLEEVLSSLPRGPELLVEVKDPDATEQVVRLIEKYDRTNTTVLISFITEVAEEARALSDKIKIGVNIDSVDKAQWCVNKARELRLYSLNPPIEGLKLYGEIARKMLYQARSLGLRIYVWTVNSLVDALEWIELVDAYITDDIVALLELRRLGG